MIAVVFDEAGARVDTSHAPPTRPAGEALVDVRVAGVCDTDLQLARGYMGFRGVPGHEFVGVVRAADDPKWIGKRVVADINAGCGACAECTERAGHHCATRTVLGIVARGGAFAEQLAVPERCLVAVPDAVTDDCAVFAEPLAAAVHVLDDVASIPPEERIVVLGDGKLGLLIARALAGAGRRVATVGRHDAKLALARAAGVDAFLEADAGSLRGAAAVVEATGSASGLALAFDLVRPRGTVILKTTVSGPTPVDWSPVVIHELRVVGSRCGNMTRAISMLADGFIDPRPLIQARYPLARAKEALLVASQKGTLKVLIEMGR